MSEMFENAMALLGMLLVFVLPVGLFAAYMDYRVSHKKQLNAFDQKRLEANLEIIRLLTAYVEKYPSQRIGQALRNIGILQSKLLQERGTEEWESGTPVIDHVIMHEEPSIILERVKKELAQQEQG